MTKSAPQEAIDILRKCKTKDAFLEAIAHHGEIFIAMLMISADACGMDEEHITDGVDILKKQAVENYRAFQQFIATGTGYTQ